MEDRDTDQVERFGNERLKVVSKMNYLGVYLTDTLRRNENVAERIKKAYKAMRVILHFVKRTRLEADAETVQYCDSSSGTA
jgi:hypothetical protein